MKQPTTYEELLRLVDLSDLDEILSFSGINDHNDKIHQQLKKHWDYINQSIIHNTKNPSINLTNDFYTTIIKCIQDFYWWSHRFNHEYSSIYQRVMDALEIDLIKDQIDFHFKK